jgi:Ca-activated chloride channel family protein
VWSRRLPILLIAGALVFLAIAFTQFRFLRSGTAPGIVVLTIDASESMSKTDVAPTRLDAAVEAARAFLDGLPTDIRVGLVSFASAADVLVGPGSDRGAVDDALSSLPRAEGTVIGDGLAASLDAIEALWRRDGTGPAAVVLLSDGRDTGSNVPPDRAAERAGELKVPVYTVVLGQPADAGRGANAELLQQMAGVSGGSSFTATSAGRLIDVYRGLQTRLSSELKISDYGALFVGIAALFAIAATVSILLTLRAET